MTTWNPTDKSTRVTLSNGDLTSTGQTEVAGTQYGWARSTTSKTTGKKYAESNVGNTDGGGFAAALGTALLGSNLNNFLGVAANESAYYDTGQVYVNNAVVATLASYTDGDVVGLAVDIGAGKGWYSKNGVFASGDPGAGTGEHFTFTAGTALFIGFTTADETPAHVFTAAFGATAFANDPPSGFEAWDVPAAVARADAYGAGRNWKALAEAEFEIHKIGPTKKEYERKLDEAKREEKSTNEPPQWLQEFVEEEYDYKTHFAAMDLILARVENNIRSVTEAWLRAEIEKKDEEEAAYLLLLN